jgi:hypothetical protein
MKILSCTRAWEKPLPQTQTDRSVGIPMVSVTQEDVKNEFDSAFDAGRFLKNLQES